MPMSVRRTQVWQASVANSASVEPGGNARSLRFGNGERCRVTLRDGSVPPLRLDDDTYVEREYHATLAAEIRATGGQWAGSDYYARPADIAAEINRVGATALRVSLRDLALLSEVAGLWHLHVGSDGSSALGPVATLTGLRSLHLSVRGIRGVVDPSALPELRWLTTPLGGKGGAPILASLAQGHPTIEHLRVRETKVRSIREVVANLPRLQSFSVSYADYIRSPGDLTPVAGTLTELRMSMVPGLRSLEGIETAARLEHFSLSCSSITDLTPLAALPNLREVDITMAGGVRITDVEELR